MTYSPNANWNAKVAASTQAPVYYVKFDGVTNEFSTHPVKGASPAKTNLMRTPSGSSIVVDFMAGTQTIQTASFELIDIGSEITDLIATEAAGAPVSTMVNRKVTIYGGYRGLTEADYAPIFTGRVTGVRANPALTGYFFTASDLGYMIDGEIMTKATAAKPTTITGNVVNMYWSILTGTFDTGHATFPLDTVSIDDGSNSAPTGIGISTTLIDEANLVIERDNWHPSDVVSLDFDDPVQARSYLQDEMFRIFQCFPKMTGDGKIGLKFDTPPFSLVDAPTLDKDTIISVSSWSREYKDHLNSFTINGQYDDTTGVYSATYSPAETTEDTTDQSATEEKIEYVGNSKWLFANGTEIAAELVGRLRVRYLNTPAELVVIVPFTRINAEQGDVYAVTHPQLPDLFTGTRGITSKLMTVISRTPRYSEGVLELRLLDTGYSRFGVIMPSGKSSNYAGATEQERNTFCFIADASNLMSDGSAGYKLI